MDWSYLDPILNQVCFNSRVWKYPELLGRYLRWVYISRTLCEACITSSTTRAVDLSYTSDQSPIKFGLLLRSLSTQSSRGSCHGHTMITSWVKHSSDWTELSRTGGSSCLLDPTADRLGLGGRLKGGKWQKDDSGGIRTHAQKTAALTQRLRPLGHRVKHSESGTRTPVCCVRGSYDNHLHQFGRVENSGIEPETSCMLSTRSTNWANPPQLRAWVQLWPLTGGISLAGGLHRLSWVAFGQLLTACEPLSSSSSFRNFHWPFCHWFISLKPTKPSSEHHPEVSDTDSTSGPAQDCFASTPKLVTQLD